MNPIKQAIEAMEESKSAILPHHVDIRRKIDSAIAALQSMQEHKGLRSALQRVDPLSFNNFDDLLSAMEKEGICYTQPQSPVVPDGLQWDNMVRQAAGDARYAGEWEAEGWSNTMTDSNEKAEAVSEEMARAGARIISDQCFEGRKFLLSSGIASLVYKAMMEAQQESPKLAASKVHEATEKLRKLFASSPLHTNTGTGEEDTTL